MRKSPPATADAMKYRREAAAHTGLTSDAGCSRKAPEMPRAAGLYVINFALPLYFYLQKQQNAPSKIYVRGRRSRPVLILTLYSEEIP